MSISPSADADFIALSASTAAVEPVVVNPNSAAALFGGGMSVLSARSADVGTERERRRRKLLAKLGALLAIPTLFLWYRVLAGRPFNIFALPHISMLTLFPIIVPLAIVGAVVVPPLIMGRSPHTTYTPEQIKLRLADVVGVDTLREEVVRSLNLFLSHREYTEKMGGRPRRGLLFEGPPGTGKTHMARAMAAEAGVPFLFVSATAFQSMMYGATARKIRSYFKVLRKTALREGGVIGFIEEIDAIAGARDGVSSMTAAHFGTTPAGLIRSRNVMSSATEGVVNELLVQMQSFEEPTGGQKLVGKITDGVNRFLPPTRQLPKPVPPKPNVLIIAATNRASSLDPALTRPGRFDRQLTFDLPAKASRRQLIDYFLIKRSHGPELVDPEHRDALAAVTPGWSPAKLEFLLDEALINAVRRGDDAMNWHDVESARITAEVGMGAPVAYTPHERELIATHEAGHATMAWLVAPERRLEILTIVKRGEALGMLAHGDREDVFTRSRTEMRAMMQIAFGGQVAEEQFFGDVSTGPAGDLAYATTVAVQMVGAAGMEGSSVSFAAVRDGALTGTDLVGKVLADGASRARVERLLDEQKEITRELMRSNRHLVEALRDALLSREELVGSEITAVLEAAAAVSPTVIDLRDVPETADDDDLESAWVQGALDVPVEGVKAP
ncbi:MAG: ATPase central domain protein [Mycobacterium sp.]|nr:ATPase central domain protein [Mycobacterium sp.]